MHSTLLRKTILATLLTILIAARSQVNTTAANRTLCSQYQTWTQNWPYIVNNNAWRPDGSGSICTYICETCAESSNSWYSIWEWTSEPPAVHAYPNIDFKDEKLPLRLGELASLYVAAEWEFKPAALLSGQGVSGVVSDDVQANVVLDVFADEDPEKAQTPSKQRYEFMIWCGVFGNASKPIGNRTPRDPPVVVLGDEVEFTLFNGTNSNGQEVYSWIANQTMNTFEMDVAPLLGYLWKKEGISDEVYIGTVQFGHETFYAESQMNFSVTSYEARVETTGRENGGETSLPVATALGAAGHGVELPLKGMIVGLNAVITSVVVGGLSIL